MKALAFVIYGAGGYCKVVIDIIHALGAEVRCVFDDFPEKSNYKLMGVPVRKYDPNCYPDLQIVIAIGNNEVRKSLAHNLKHNFATLIHPKAVVSSSASIGKGSVIMANAIIQAEAKLGEHVIINAGVCVDHEAMLDNFTHIGALVYIGGAAQIGENCNIRPGALVKRLVKVPQDTFIAPNAIVEC
jgi:acetyltransferase EpsM